MVDMAGRPDSESASGAPTPDVAAALSRLALFAGCSVPELERIASLLHPAHVTADTVVLREREEGDRFVIIATGEARVSRGDDPDEHQLAVLGPGCFVGEMSLLEGQPRSATVTAVTPLTVYLCSPEEFAILLATVPGLEEEVARTAAKRRETNQQRAARRLQVRVAGPQDNRLGVEDMLDRLSPESRYLRFLTASTAASVVEAETLQQLDGVDRVAVVAEVDGEVVGLARFNRSDDRVDVAEVSIAVEDQWQGKGIGLNLLGALGEAAKAQGIRTFHVTILPENPRSTRLFRRFSPNTRLKWDDGLLEGEADLPA
jgi:CRP-like cAMP-binding protein